MVAFPLNRLLLPATLLCGALQASPSPETTLLVVNADSPLSRTVANHYLDLRPIPQRHVVWVHGLSHQGGISLKEFRQRILAPIREALEQDDLELQIDTILYSADFPYRVRIRRAIDRAGIAYTRYLGPAAALTGLTYFRALVEADRADYVAPNANGYFRHEVGAPARPGRPLTAVERKNRQRARTALRKQQYPQAVTLTKPLVRTHPRATYLRRLLAQALAGAGRTDAALEQLQQLEQAGYRKTLVLRNLREFRTLAGDPRFESVLQAMDRPRRRFEQPEGFEHRIHWGRSGLGGSDLDRYTLSALLAYTGQRGNSLPEILQYLKRSTAADAHHPDGTVYLMENDNVRTETRQPWYTDTCALLATLNRRCRIVRKGDGEDGVVPRNRDDIIGLTTGARHIHWKRAHSRLLPGALAEALTSYGGDFHNPSQDKLSVFLRHGASGSSGAVVEPYALHQKFPLPLMHYYYALGYSLAEAWYQAVATPYQAVLVGDPLTRPFADPLSFQPAGSAAGTHWQGEVTVRFESPRPDRIDHFELWIDGRPTLHLAPGQEKTLDSRTLADGHHELHWVAVEREPRRLRTTHHRWVRIDNHGLTPTLKATPPRVTFGAPVQLTGRARPGARIALRQGRRSLGQTTADVRGRWRLTLDSARLGLGRNRLQAVSELDGMAAFSQSLILEVTDPPSLHAPYARRPEGRGGLALTVTYASGEVDHRVVRRVNGHLGQALRSGQRVVAARMQGSFHTDRTGFHQLTVQGSGLKRLRVDGRDLTPQNAARAPLVFIPLWLQPGWHTIELEPDPADLDHLLVVLGGAVPPLPLDDRRASAGGT